MLASPSKRSLRSSLHPHPNGLCGRACIPCLHPHLNGLCGRACIPIRMVSAVALASPYERSPNGLRGRACIPIQTVSVVALASPAFISSRKVPRLRLHPHPNGLCGHALRRQSAATEFYFPAVPAAGSSVAPSSSRRLPYKCPQAEAASSASACSTSSQRLRPRLHRHHMWSLFRRPFPR